VSKGRDNRSAETLTVTIRSAGLLGRWVAVTSVVGWSVCADALTHRGGCPRSSLNHIDERVISPPPEATHASTHRYIFVVKIPPAN